MDKMSIIVRHCRTFTERRLKEFDLTFGEQVVIMFLSTNDNINQDTISKKFMVDKGMVAKTLNNLEQKGYILRKQNLDNKRENIISLTQKGTTTLESMGTILQEWNEILYKGMSKEEIECVKRLTAKMEENIANYLK